MSTHMRVLTIVILLGLSLAACGSDNGSSTTPSPAMTLSGTWSGSLAVEGQPGVMTWTLTQNDTLVAGTARVGLPNGIVLLNGVLSGTLNGSTLTYTITVGPNGIPTQPACTGQLGGTTTVALGTSSTLSGNYTVLNSTCSTSFSSGDFTLNKTS